MKYMPRHLFIFTLLILLCVPVLGNAGFRMVSGEVTQAGIYQAESMEEVKAPETTTGYTTNATGLKLVKSTDTIPARLGTSFGFEYVLIGL